MDYDTMKVFDWWMSPAETLDPLIKALTSPSYQWPAPVRKAYVLAWPVAAPLRLVTVLLLMLVFVILGGAGYLMAAANCIWLGKRTPWQ
jgi:hypothetical protein